MSWQKTPTTVRRDSGVYRTMPSAHTVAAREAWIRADNFARAGEWQKSAVWARTAEAIERRGGR